MYTSTLLASLALMASSVLAGSPGQAVVINKCAYPVYLFAVPSADGGYSEVDQTLQPGSSFTQTWTQLSNGNGWSIKLSKTQALTRDILQYEYTYHNDGTIWYDLSCVDGNPWANDWQVSATGPNCNPRQTFYRFDTDDAFGMQDCVDSSSVTVTLCTSDSTGGSIISSIVAPLVAAIAPSSTSSVVAAPVVPTTSAPVVVAAQVVPSTSAPAVVTTTSPTQAPAVVPTTSSTQAPAATLANGKPLEFANDHFVNANVVVADKAAASPTTLATVVSTKPTTTAAAVVNDDVDVVTEVVTVVETAYAYETYVPEKRHVHHPNHPHFV